MKAYENLNDIPIPIDTPPYMAPADNSLNVYGAHLSVYFRNLKAELIKRIEASNFVVGCVAWLTDFDILHALSKVEHLSIVVQKEDFLRPDLGAGTAWRCELRRAYDSLQSNLFRPCLPGLAGELSICGDLTVEPIRCVGNHNADRAPAFPRMHNKFLVFGHYEDSDEHFCPPDTPPLHTVWTGSFNFTQNAVRSLENAVVIHSVEAARAYYDEYAQILALSEPLDWESVWCEPEYRIGT